MSEKFLVNLSTALAHSAVYFTKQQYPHCEGVMCGDENVPSVVKQMQTAINATNRGLPQYGDITRAEILPNEQAQLDAAKVISPQYYDLLTSLYSQYGPQLAATGADIDKLVGDRNLQDVMSRTYQAAGADRALDPEYYATRSAASDKLGQLLGSIDLNNADPEAERLVNQELIRGGNITPSAQQTTANALSFGDQLQKRRTALGQAISAATQFLPQSRSGFGTQLANAAGGSNAGALQGLSQFGGVQQPGGEAYGQASDVFGAATGIRGQKTALDENNQAGVMKVHTGIVDTLGAI